MTDARPDAVRVLVIEDESLVAMMLEDMLDMAGYRVVGTASNIEQAEQNLAAAGFDVAILDVNLNGKLSFGIAEKLRGMRVPFVLSTGYGQAGVPLTYRDAPLIAKPFRFQDLENALVAALRPAHQA